MLQDGTEKYSQLPHYDKTSSYIQGLKFQPTFGDSHIMRI